MLSLPLSYQLETLIIKFLYFNCVSLAKMFGKKQKLKTTVVTRLYNWAKCFYSFVFKSLLWSHDSFTKKHSKQRRSSHQTCPTIKAVLINFIKITGRHLYHSLFFKKVAGLRRATLLKKRLWHRCLPVNFTKLLRTPFLQNTSGRWMAGSNNMQLTLDIANTWYLQLFVISIKCLGLLASNWCKQLLGISNSR